MNDRSAESGNPGQVLRFSFISDMEKGKNCPHRPMKIIYRWALGAIALVALGVLLLFGQFNHRSLSEAEDIAQVNSPTNKWIAKVVMVIYGDHWFVNDARYEVRILQANEKEQEVLVYSAMASGPASLAVKWRNADELEIQDSAVVLRDAVRNPHPSVRIDYLSADGVMR